MHGVGRRTNLRIVLFAPGIDTIVLKTSNEQLTVVFFSHQVRGQGPLYSGAVKYTKLVDDIERLPLRLHHLTELDSSRPILVRDRTITEVSKASFVDYAIRMIQHSLYRWICESKSSAKGEIRYQGHRMGQVMQSSLHASYPIYYIASPHWIIVYSGITLHPYTILIGATGTVEVLQVQVIRHDTIVAALTCRQCKVLHLPAYQSRIAKIEGHIRVTKLVGRGHTITAIEDPIGMDGSPTCQAFQRSAIRERTVISMESDVVGQEDVGVG